MVRQHRVDLLHDALHFPGCEQLRVRHLEQRREQRFQFLRLRLLLLAFPPYGLWPLAWFGFVPALLAQYRFLPAKWTCLAQAVFSAVWLGPFLARLFGSGYGPIFQYLGIWIAILNFFAVLRIRIPGQDEKQKTASTLAVDRP